jgi:hypothetical protein
MESELTPLRPVLKAHEVWEKGQGDEGNTNNS